MKDILKWLFPAKYREFKHKRLIIVSLRSLHIICFSILLGGYYFQQSHEVLMPWFLGALFTGMGMFLIDMYGSFSLLFEVRGISILLKLLLLSCIPALDSDFQIALLMFVVALSSYISHTTGSIRHRNLMPETLQQKLKAYMNS